MNRRITDVMAVFEGAVSYTELRNMPFPEFMDLYEEAKRINDSRKK